MYFIKQTANRIKVADEVFIATALLHREHPNKETFTISEIVNRAKREKLAGELRPGVRVYASTHCVANRSASRGRYRMLFATSERNRRLVRSTDEVHPSRTGKIWPDADDLPERYTELIEWAKERYLRGQPRTARHLESIFQMRGMGKELWRGEDPDAYVRRLREGWAGSRAGKTN